MTTSRTILFIYAHPDDESFWGAGVAARYSSESVRVGLVMATRGERGTCGRPPLCSIEELPRIRERELRAAAKIAGFAPIEFLGYEDQKLTEAPGDEIRRKLVTIIRRERPAIIGTFDPDGGNRHPDHVAISRFTSDAIAAAADYRWYADAGVPHRVTRLVWTPPLPPWESGREPSCDRAGTDFVIDTGPYWRVRADALAAHETQREGIDRLFLKRPNVEQILSVEAFRHAWGPSLPAVPTPDLFAGIADPTTS